MVAAVGIQSSAGRTLATVRQSSPEMRVSEGRGLVAINFPSAAMNVSQGQFQISVRRAAHIEVPQAQAMVVGKGRISNPRLRAWYFSLDGHDFYVLRLGDRFGTLVYDLTTEQWCDWDSLDLPFWRANTGFNWLGANRQAPVYGSNVLVGDDTWGLVWILDPKLGYDEHPDYLNPTQNLGFERVVMGQIPMRGRTTQPCYVAFITASMGAPSLSGASILLETSDDAGHTFDSHGAIETVAGDFKQELAWYSLGQMTAPGRLFKITDNGAVARIDSLDVNDG